MIAEKNVLEMIRTVAGLEKGAAVAEVDLAAAARNYLLSHGMEEQALLTLIENLG